MKDEKCRGEVPSPDSNVNIIDQLPGDIRRIAEVVGVEAAVKIAQAFRGTFIYIHNLDDFIRQIRDKKIRSEYAGGGKVRTLAIKNRLTERQIRNILNIEPASDASPSLLELMK
jgi:Mor family transcriptional regulator